MPRRRRPDSPPRLGGFPRHRIGVVLVGSLGIGSANVFHLWLNTSFEEKNIILLLLAKDNTSAIYVREPLPSGKGCIQKLQHNLRQHCLSPISSTFYNFEEMIFHCYRDLLLEGTNSTDSTGEENHIFAAYGLTPLKVTA